MDVQHVLTWFNIAPKRDAIQLYKLPYSYLTVTANAR